MANYDLTGAGAAPADGLNQNHSPEWQLLTKTLDFSKINAGAPLAASSTDTVDLLTIPAGFVVEDVYLVTVTQGTASSVIAVGDASDTAYYFAAGTTAPASAAGSIVQTGTTAGAASKFKDVTSVTTFSARNVKVYTTASTLRLLGGGANFPQAGKLKFVVRGFQLI